MSDDFDLAPPPLEQLVIVRAEAAGWYVRHDNTIVACFSTARELASWIEDTCSSLDPPLPPERMPAILDEPPAVPARRSLWAVIAGGRR